MIIQLKFPKINLPKLDNRRSKRWQKWFVLFPRLVYVEGSNKRRLIFPGWYETRVTMTIHRRVWRELEKSK